MENASSAYMLWEWNTKLKKNALAPIWWKIITVWNSFYDADHFSFFFKFFQTFFCHMILMIV